MGTALDYVDRLLDERFAVSRSVEPIFLATDRYVEFMTAVEPIYERLYGALICQKEAADAGYDNILYRGVAVCLQPSSISKNTPTPPDLAPVPRSKPDTGQGSD